MDWRGVLKAEDGRGGFETRPYQSPVAKGVYSP
jgi:hypothetical protein